MKHKILALLYEGLHPRAVAQMLGISPAQVRVTKAREAGYSSPSVLATRARIAEAEAKRIEQMRLTPDRIMLGHDKVTFIDPTDFDLIWPIRWYAHQEGNAWYVYGTLTKRLCGKPQTVKLHRFLLSAPAGVLVDHIDGDPLNNTRSNLRFATARQNALNSAGRSAGTKYKGVYFFKPTRQWTGQVKAEDGRRVSIGYYDTDHEAAIARDRIARELHGEFARLNNIPNSICYQRPEPASETA